jgi:hypothetical protein
MMIEMRMEERMADAVRVGRAASCSLRVSAQQRWRCPMRVQARGGKRGCHDDHCVCVSHSPPSVIVSLRRAICACPFTLRALLHALQHRVFCLTAAV